MLADNDLASRLALKTLLSTAGYAVDGAAGTSEAVAQLDSNEYQLVLADLKRESGESGACLLAYARQKEFRPATAFISLRIGDNQTDLTVGYSASRLLSVTNEDVFYLLSGVAELIGNRADRKMRRANACPQTWDLAATQPA